jgi:hypothetical protein
MTKKKYDAANVDAGRAYSNAYVEFVHYAERLFESATTLAPEHAKTSATHAH